MIVSDRDLLVLEPNLFRDVGWSAQRLFDGGTTISGTTLTVTVGPADLVARGVKAGHVAIVNGVAMELTAVTSGATATVSRLRADPSEGLIQPGDVASTVPTSVTTFDPQIGVAHGQILRLLGVEPGGAVLEGQLEESAILRPRSLWLFEALLTLQAIYSSAAALTGDQGPLALRAELFRQRAAAERSRAVAYLDLNGDGVADVARYVGVAQWVRG